MRMKYVVVAFCCLVSDPVELVSAAWSMSADWDESVEKLVCMSSEVREPVDSVSKFCSPSVEHFRAVLIFLSNDVAEDASVAELVHASISPPSESIVSA